MENMLSIGEVAKRAGVSVQTLRHYDKLGLLIPSHVTSAGYRHYSASDCVRLELIRALRDVGFDLHTIAQLLQDGKDVDKAIRLQIEALEAQKRAIQRQQLILKATIHHPVSDDDEARLAQLHRKNLLGQLDKLEREAFLARHLGWSAGGTQSSQAVWRAAIFELPEVMDVEQLEAWLELAEIAADPRFRQTLESQWQSMAGISEASVMEWQQLSALILDQAAQALQMNHSLDETSSQMLLDEWIGGFARLQSRTVNTEFLCWLVRYYESHYDPRIVRYWELIARIKRLPYDPAHVQAFTWLLAGLQARVAQINCSAIQEGT